MASGFTEYELMAAEWSRKKKLEREKETPKSDTNELRSKSNISHKLVKQHRRSRSHSPARRSRSRTPPRRRDRISEAENLASLYAPYDPTLAHQGLSFTGEVIGRDPAIDKSKRAPSRSRSRSRSRDRMARDTRRSARRDSRSSSTERRGRSRSPNHWTHDKYNSARSSPSPVRIVPSDYRPPSPEWVSRAGGVAIMRKRIKKSGE